MNICSLKGIKFRLIIFLLLQCLIGIITIFIGDVVSSYNRQSLYSNQGSRFSTPIKIYHPFTLRLFNSSVLLHKIHNKLLWAQLLTLLRTHCSRIGVFWNPFSNFTLFFLSSNLPSLCDYCALNFSEIQGVAFHIWVRICNVWLLSLPNSLYTLSPCLPWLPQMLGFYLFYGWIIFQCAYKLYFLIHFSTDRYVSLY